MFILKKGHQPGVYVPLRALFLVKFSFYSAIRENVRLKEISGRSKESHSQIDVDCPISSTGRGNHINHKTITSTR